MPWTRTDRLADRTSRIGMVALYLIAAGSVVGFGVFRIWPSLLATIPDAAAVYPRAFAFFPRAQILLAFGLLAFYLTWKAGTRWVTAFLAVYLISLASELAGTTVGLPFGPYHYTDALGIKWFAHVPVLIPVSWFTMALPSFVLAGGARYEGVSPRVLRIVVGSVILLAWDLALDPAMSAATAFWVWGKPGPYYGMPLLNLFGWFVTGVALMIALTAAGVERWAPRLSPRWLLAYYGANLALPVGLAAVGAMWLALVATGIVMAGCYMVIRPRAVPLRAVA